LFILLLTDPNIAPAAAPLYELAEGPKKQEKCWMPANGQLLKKGTLLTVFSF
jgi:hypothetical protein